MYRSCSHYNSLLSRFSYSARRLLSLITKRWLHHRFAVRDAEGDYRAAVCYIIYSNRSADRNRRVDLPASLLEKYAQGRRDASSHMAYGSRCCRSLCGARESHRNLWPSLQRRTAFRLRQSQRVRAVRIAKRAGGGNRCMSICLCKQAKENAICAQRRLLRLAIIATIARMLKKAMRG